MNKKVKQALKQSFTPPPTQYREQFINSLAYPKASFSEVVIAQISFIRKRVWLSFILSVCFAFCCTHFVNLPENIVTSVSAILPFFSLCVITEVCKSTAYKMEETELACKHNLPKIMLMRLGILGTVSFMVLVSLTLIVGKSDFGMLRNTIYISVPYLLSSYFSLLTISKFHSKESIYICATISVTVSVLMLLVGSSYKFIYNAGFTAIWIALFTLLVGLLSYSLVQFIKSQGELQWNLL